jgi:hypothetical protein
MVSEYDEEDAIWVGEGLVLSLKGAPQGLLVARARGILVRSVDFTEYRYFKIVVV